MLGGSGDDKLNGDAGNDTLEGNTGKDILDGGTGDDRLVGGAGNDIYKVDSIRDKVVETDKSNSVDTVQSSVNYTLPELVEHLELLGMSNVKGTGNALNNRITGNAGDNALDGLAGQDTLTGGDGADTLNGGAGNDSLSGGAGDDIYIVGSSGDRVIEKDDEGEDEIQSSVSFTLADAVEMLTLTGSKAVNGIGNELDNLLNGNALANQLSGEEGNDTLVGNAGNDTLTGGAGDDQLDGGAGNDTVIYAGNYADYQFTRDEEGNSWTIQAIGDDDDGTDSLTAVELVKFADVTKNANELDIDDGAEHDTPVFISASVNANTLLLNYADKDALDTVHLPAAGAFQVMTNGVANAVTAVAINANTVALTLAKSVTAEQVVTFTYNDPAVADDVDAIQDEFGNDAVSLAAVAAVNETAPIAPTVPTYSITAPATAAEGATANFVVATTNVANGTALAYTLSGVNAADVVGGLTGFAVVNGNTATITVALATDALFGESDVLSVTLTADSTKTASVAVTDTTLPVAPTYLITAPTTASEGATANFTLATTNVANGTALAYTLSGVDVADVVGGLTGFAVVNGGAATIPVALATDALFGETDVLSVTLAADSTKTASVFVTDTTLPPAPTYSITTPATAAEGATANFTVATTNVANGTALAYSLGGVDAADVVGGLTGFAVVNGGAATIPVALATDALFGETDVLSVTLAADSTKTASVFVTDTTLPPAPTYSITTPATAAEGATANFTVATTNVANGTALAYSLGGVDAADVVGGLTGFAVVNGGAATIPVALATDALFGETDVLSVTLAVAPTKTASVAVTDTTLPVPTMPEPLPIPTMPEPLPIPIVPEPLPIPTMPEPLPVPTMPEPLPIPTMPEPLPIPTMPEPLPIPTMPEPLPVPTMPEPLPVPTMPEPLPVPTMPEPLPIPTAPPPPPPMMFAYSLSNSDGVIHLTGLATAQDSQLFSVESFKSVFGADSLI
ncbi:SwmB domain-containing protein [Chromatium okenii]|uniref:SwmB domain-containing protein n=1 Tax=Chromatium okenii TaxID=61644 RepID=UPI0026EB426B|nr:SwmB domain-containing protein [Chromatium okenii]MBV5311152.1 hypothetical protein [Chromatium okenii]